METPFDQLGGEAVVRQIAAAFYDHMDAHEPALAHTHKLDEQGRVHPDSRERFALFLIGWLGGPQTYMERHGHPRLRMRHAHVAIDQALRDAWLRCMHAALAQVDSNDRVKQALASKFAEVAEFLRNT